MHPVFKAKQRIRENNRNILLYLMKNQRELVARLQLENQQLRAQMLKQYSVIID